MYMYMLLHKYHIPSLRKNALPVLLFLLFTHPIKNKF